MKTQFNVGDRVVHKEHGEGVVIEITKHDHLIYPYPVMVKFDEVIDTIEEQDGVDIDEDCYTLDGREDRKSEIVLRKVE
jgi:hypothetical protein